MDWVAAHWTFDAHGFQRHTDRCYARFMVSDVLIDRLLTLCAGLPSRFHGTHQDGAAIFQALLEVGNAGQYRTGRVIGFGYSPMQHVWVIVAWHPDFAPVAIGDILPEIVLSYNDGDIVQINTRYMQLRHEERTWRS